MKKIYEKTDSETRQIDDLLTGLVRSIEASAALPVFTPGLLCYYAIQHQVTQQPAFARLAVQQLSGILEQDTLEKHDVPTLTVIEYLRRAGQVSSEVSYQIDENKKYLLKCTAEWLDETKWEYLYHALEVGYYLAHGSVSQHVYLEQWIKLVAAKATSGRFFSQYAQIEPVFLLGVEGLTGILLMLEAVAQISENPTIHKLLGKGTSYLLTYRQEVDFSAHRYAVFPRLANIDQQNSPWFNMLAWSGSDLTQALLFYRVATLLQDTALRKAADLIGLNTLLRKEATETTADSANFYQGTAGIAQCYRVLHQASGLEAYQQGYKYWIDRTIQCLTSESLPTEETGGLLHGSVGIILTLLTYKHSEISSWGRVVLV